MMIFTFSLSMQFPVHNKKEKRREETTMNKLWRTEKRREKGNQRCWEIGVFDLFSVLQRWLPFLLRPPPSLFRTTKVRLRFHSRTKEEEERKETSDVESS
jgi:hypothetical protein